jgi:hypothetical protein
MTRKSSTFILSLIVLAVALAPASAFASYESVTAIVGPSETGDDGYSSVSALVGDAPSGSQQRPSTQADPSSLNALVGADGVSSPRPQAVAVSDDGDSFSWSDAGIGALIAAGLLLMMLAATVLVARHRRTTAEYRA